MQKLQLQKERHFVLLGAIFFQAKNTIGSRCAAIVSADIDIKFDRKLAGKNCWRFSLSARSIEVWAGVVNSGYRGIIYVVLYNLSCDEVGDKITQIIFEKNFPFSVQ